MAKVDEHMEGEFTTLLEQRKLNDWNVGTIDGEKIFLNSQGSNESRLMFCLVSLQHDPCLVIVSDVENQCKTQGFLDQSVVQIKKNILSKISAGFDFHRDTKGVWFTVSVFSLEITLRAPLEKMSDAVSVQVYQTVLNNTLNKATLLQGISDDLLTLIDSKDRAIEYLQESIQELGGERIVSRWAPKGSYNFRSLERYAPPLELQSCLELSDDPMKMAESLAALRPYFRNYTRSPSRSPRKRQREMAAKNLAQLLNQDQARSTELRRENSSPRRAASDSPSKRQKFGKVKITKGR